MGALGSCPGCPLGAGIHLLAGGLQKPSCLLGLYQVGQVFTEQNPCAGLLRGDALLRVDVPPFKGLQGLSSAARLIPEASGNHQVLRGGQTA